MPTPDVKGTHMQILSARHVQPEESLRLGVVSGWYQGERHLRHRSSRDAGRLPCENRRNQSTAGKKEILTERFRAKWIPVRVKETRQNKSHN
jgi:hypothetical protein